MKNNIIKFDEQEFRNRITKIIIEYPTTEKKLAELLGVSQGTINRWKNQKLMPQIELLAKLSILTNLSLDYLILGIDSKEN